MMLVNPRLRMRPVRRKITQNSRTTRETQKLQVSGDGTHSKTAACGD